MSQKYVKMDYRLDRVYVKILEEKLNKVTKRVK